jgi:SAM-dependent methyltransferase
MSKLSPGEDAFGQAMLDYYENGGGFEIIERDDGVIRPGPGPAIYFLPRNRWSSVERRAMRFARGRVLDLGCGAGRVALDLQERGLEVVGIDNSPGAVEVCRRRGLRHVELRSYDELDSGMGLFDTFLLLCNSFGIAGTPEGTVSYLHRLAKLGSPRTRLIASCRDPYRTDDPRHLAYHERNRETGRWPGAARFRVRYLEHSTPWIDLLLVSPDETRRLATEAGWGVRKLLDDGDPSYVAVLEPGA